jgi:hypothetical protein
VVAAGLAVAALVLWRTSGVPELVYLLPSIVFVGVAMARSPECPSARELDTALAVRLIAVVALPSLLLIAPYLLRGELGAFTSAVVLQPTSRLDHAHVAMPPVILIVLGLPLLAGLSRAVNSWWLQAAGAVALSLALAALSSPTAYQVVWQSVRGAAALLPVVVCWRLRHVQGTRERRVQLLSASVLAWIALNQVPAALPVYFCYLAPVGLFCGVSLYLSNGGRSIQLVTVAAALLVFALLSMNRSAIEALGHRHRVAPPLDAPLGLERAHLTVYPINALLYRALVRTVNDHVGERGLMAGPDCPEVFYLTGRYNPAGVIFDFLGSPDTARPENAWLERDVIVINHQPAFSPPLSDQFVAQLRDRYAKSARLGGFEIRWRQ